MSLPMLGFALAMGTCSLVDEAIVDTGYDGGLIIPARAGDEIDSPADSDEITMPDGYQYRVDTWQGEIDLGRASVTVDVVAFGREFILGRKVLDQFEVCFEYGERVTLKHERAMGGAGL